MSGYTTTAELSAREIAAKLWCSNHAVNEAVKRFKIKKSEKDRRPKYVHPYTDKSEKQLKLELKVISLINALNNKGLSYRSICKILNEKEESTPTGKMRQSTVKRIVQTSGTEI